MRTFYRLAIWSDNTAYVSKTDISKELQRKVLRGERIEDGMLMPTLTIKNKTKKFPDFMGDSISSIVVSDKFKKILEASPDKNFLQFFKCQYLNLKRNDNYWLLNILNNIEAMDKEKSTFTTFEHNPDKVDTISKLVMKEDVIGDRTIFRIKEDHYHVFISEEMRTRLIEENITGILIIQNMDLRTMAEAK